MVSLDKSGLLQTLHKTGKCWRVPGVHFVRFRDLDEGEEREGKFRRICFDCSPDGKIEVSFEKVSSSSDSSDSSSTGAAV